MDHPFDIMQRDDKDLKALFVTYRGVVIQVEKSHYEAIKAGKPITTRVLFTNDAKSAGVRAGTFFEAVAKKAGGEDKAPMGFLSDAANLWHAELPKKVQSRSQALGGANAASEDEVMGM